MTLHLKLTEQQKLYVETSAVQNVIKKRVGELIMARMEEIQRDLDLLAEAGTELTNKEIEQKYLGQIITL